MITMIDDSPGGTLNLEAILKGTTLADGRPIVVYQTGWPDIHVHCSTYSSAQSHGLTLGLLEHISLVEIQSISILCLVQLTKFLLTKF